MIALVAAQATGVEVDLAPAVAYLEANALVYAQSGAGQAAKLVLAVVAAGGDPRDVGGVDPLSLAEKGVDPETGWYGKGIYDHALVMLALAAAGEPVPPEAVALLVEPQLRDGSWAFDGSKVEGAGDTNTTAVVIQALFAAGEGENEMTENALEYLASAQDENGGFPFQPGPTTLPDANSTALAVQAIVAAGQDPASADWKDAAAALLAFQNESGAFRYQDEPPDDNLFATTQALPAVAGLALPIGGVAGDGSPEDCGPGTEVAESDGGTPVACAA